MVLVKKQRYRSRNTDYDLFVYQAEETGEYRIYVAKEGFGVGDIFMATQEMIQDTKATYDTDFVDALIATAKNAIDRNEFGEY